MSNIDIIAHGFPLCVYINVRIDNGSVIQIHKTNLLNNKHYH